MRSASRLRVWFGIFAAVAAATAGAVAPGLYRTVVLGSAFLAQRLCGDVFVSKRDPDAVLAEDLSGPGYEPLRFFQPSVDRERRLVTASAFGVGRQISVFREGLGCTHVVGKSESELRNENSNLFAATPTPGLNALWPDGERVDLATLPKGVNSPALERAMDAAFSEPDTAHPRHTRALVVVYQGRIVAERYAPRFDAAMPLSAWSLSKAALNALVGEADTDGKLALGDKALLPEWQGSGDRRRDITLDQVLRMTSGLAFDGLFGPRQRCDPNAVRARRHGGLRCVKAPPPCAGFRLALLRRQLSHSLPPVVQFVCAREGLSALSARAAVRAARHAQRGARAGFHRDLRHIVLHVRLGAGLGPARAPLPTGWRLARRAPAPGRLGRLHPDATDRRARRGIRRPYVAEDS